MQQVSAEISKCANPECKRRFHRLGQGCLKVLPVTDPLAWGLPEHVKQKVVWICEVCSARYYVRFDRRRHSVQLISRSRAQAA